MKAGHALTIATANTHFGNAISDPAYLDPIKHADVILFQEIFTSNTQQLSQTLAAADFRLIQAAPRFGLAIALKATGDLRHIEGSFREHHLAKMAAIEKRIIEKSIRLPLPTVERGLISCQIRFGGQVITIATTHPATPISFKPRARHRQVSMLQSIINDHYQNDALILGGDMNHYPRPRRIDLALHRHTKLSPVDIGNEPTWHVRGSKEEKLLTIVSKLLRKPLDSFNGQHDIILYRNHTFTPTAVKVVDIPSDHRSVLASFQLIGS